MARHTLIFGGAGFLGSHVTRRFVAAGDRVTIVDGLLPGTGGSLDHLRDVRQAVEMRTDAIEAVADLDRLVASADVQTADVLDAMRQDSGVALHSLRVDGGATANDWLMQFQSDVLGVSVRRPVVQETTALGAAYLAGLATGVWSDLSDVSKNWQLQREFVPEMPEIQRSDLMTAWRRAVSRSRD